jgi:hypothetical protein
MSMPELTDHAALRVRQRGVRASLVEALFTWGDCEAPVGGDCTVVRISRRRLREAGLRELLGPLTDRLASLALIVANDTGEVITVMRDRGAVRDWRYRPWRQGAR